MRTPEDYYFSHGYIKFKKIKGQIQYQIWNYTGDGMMSMIIEQGKLRDEQHLKELQTLGRVTE